MDSLIPLVVILVFGVPLAVGGWLISRAISARKQIEALNRRVDLLQLELVALRHQPAAAPQASSSSETAPPLAALPPRRPTAVTPPTPATPPGPSLPPERPMLRPMPPPDAPTPPQPIQPQPAPPRTPWSVPIPRPEVNWEQFMGVKGFAWLGGMALFLGIAFFVKYSFDNNLIPPELRVAIGFLAGLGLLVGGVMLSRKNFPTLSQTLCATGVVVLYAVTFACRALYHFEFFGPLPTFLLMVLITVTAFLLAVRLKALVVAVLGMLGGFLTPVLLSTGQDNPLGLFGYLAILDAGLVAVALYRRWHFLTALAALGTAALQIGWADQFFTVGNYFVGDKIFIALAVLLGFNALYLAANWLARRKQQSNPWLAGGQLGLAAVALAFAAYFFDFGPLALRPGLLFSFVFLVDLMVMALTRLDGQVAKAGPITGLAVFGLLALWTRQHLTGDLLNAALGFYLLFALFHSALPAWLQRRAGAADPATASLNHLFPPLALLLVLVPIFTLQDLTFLVWPFILLIDLLAILLAVMTTALLPVLAVLLLTFAATGALIFKIPDDLTGLPGSFMLLGVFACFFVVVGGWLAHKFKPEVFQSGRALAGDLGAPETSAALLSISSASLPFLLLIMASLRLPLANPSPLFGLALLLVVLLLGLARMFSLDWLPLTALGSTFALECAWHFNRFNLGNPQLIAPAELLGWYLLFFALFQGFPFLFLKSYAGRKLPWVAGALAGPAQYLLVHRLVTAAWPNDYMGLLPAAFAVPALGSLVAVLKNIPATSPARLTQLAWLGGVALGFITLIFPVQFDHQWLTLGWALEGAALLWLLPRVPHPGLRLVGLGLLLAAFARLAFNPAVLTYHPRSASPILNWYLYTYGVTTAALFLGARLLAPPQHRVWNLDARAVLGSLGTVLAFLLLNLEIADFFSAPGSTLTFQFSGNFARDMTYSIAWALFALGLLVYGIARRLPLVRYAAMALLCVTLIKLFFHDLAQLGQLYRIGAFVGVAIVAMLASFAYQKFFSAVNPPAGSQHETKS